jgi:hypothetical protein
MSPLPLGIIASSGGAPAGAYELIATQVLSSQTGTISFSSIPQTYRHLQIRVSAAQTNSGNYNDFYMYINNVFTASYHNHRLLGNGSQVQTSANTGTQYTIAGKATSTDITNAFGAATIDIFDYTNTTKRKAYKSLHGSISGSAGSGPIVELSSGMTGGSSAITTIDLFLLTFQFLVGSRFSLYGIKGA